MKVLYISHEIELGGASLALLEVIDEMSKKNVKIYVSVMSTKGSFYKELIKRDINIIHIKYFTDMIYGNRTVINKLKGVIKTFTNMLSAFKLAKIAKYNKIDIIHTNSSVTIIGAFISRLTGIAHIFHIREFTETKIRKYRLPGKYVYKFVNKNSKKIIVISRALYNYNLKNFANENISLIYDGINISKAAFNNDTNKSDKTINVLITGNLSENKGQEDAIRALDILIQKGYTNIKFLFAGNKSSNYYNYLTKIINNKNLNDYIEFLGYVKEIEKIRSYVDIELNCSRSEGFGRVTVEAMLNGTPIIGANNTATSELIHDGINGLLYESGNINQLSEQIIRLIENPSERYTFGKSGKEYVLKNFSSKKNGKEIYNLYQNLLRGI